MMQNYFERVAAAHDDLSFEPEVSITPKTGEAADKWNIYSHCDGLFTFYGDDGKPCLRVGLEIKTEAHKGFAGLREPRDYHLDQTTVYMACLDLPLLWILYYNKSTSNFTPPYAPWLIQFKQHRWSRLQGRIAKATALAHAQAVPAREEGFHCTWCAYGKICKPKYLNRG